MFPTIPTGGRVVTGTQTGNSGTRTFPSLTGLTKNSGDLLIAIIVAYQNSSGAGAPGGSVFSSWGGGFTEFCDQMTTNASTMAIGAAYKKSTGSETGTFTVTQAATPTGDAAFILLSIPNWDGVTVPEVTTIVNGTSSAANPASLNPANWGTEDTLWIAVAASGETGTGGTFDGISTAPSNYTNLATTSISQDAVGGVQAGVAFRQLNAASEDVGTFTLDTSNARNSAVVIAVRPVPVAVSDSPITFTVGSAGVAGRQGIVSWAAFETPLAIGSSTPTGASDLAVTFTVGSAATPKAYGASASAFTVGVASTGAPTAYGASDVPVTLTVGSAGTSLPRASSTVPIAFTVGSSGTPLARASSDAPITFTVGSAGTPKAYGASSSSFTFGVDSAGTAARQGIVSWAAFETPLAIAASGSGSSSFPITFTVGSAGTPKAYGVSSSTYTVGIDSSGAGAQAPKIAAAGLVYLHGDLDTAGVFGFSSVDLAFTVGSSGTPKAYGSSTFALTVGVDSSGTPKAYGASTSTYTVGVDSSGNVGNRGASSSTYTLDVASSGTPKAYGAATTPISVNISSAGAAPGTGSANVDLTFGVSTSGTPKAYGSSTSAFTVAVVSSGVFTPRGRASSDFTFGVSSSGTAKAYASSTVPIVFNVSSSGVGLITLGMFDRGSPTGSFYDEPSPEGTYDAPSPVGAMFDE